MVNEKEKNKLLKRYEKVCKELESLAWKEYEQGWGTQRRANTSRKCDYLAMERQRIREELYIKYGIEV